MAWICVVSASRYSGGIARALVCASVAVVLGVVIVMRRCGSGCERREIDLAAQEVFHEAAALHSESFTLLDE